ncbi:MAG: hypothetical protein GY812_08335 [Actinomycetia bacterium]|nr:hypothetical protein [Actinomycetes bacterium]
MGDTTTADGKQDMGFARRSGIVLAAAVLVSIVLAAPARGSSSTQSAKLWGTCSGVTEQDDALVSALQLVGYGVTADVSLPDDVLVGEPATASIALSFSLSDYLASGAEQLGVESVDLTGTRFPVTVRTPSGEVAATLTPPQPVIDARSTTPIDLGSTTLDLPTAAPGAVQVGFGEATIEFSASPQGLSGTATCTTRLVNGLAPGFIVDPLAPVIDPAWQHPEPGAKTGTIDLAATVTPGAGPLVDDSWSTVDTIGGGSVSLGPTGQLDFDLTSGPVEATWQVCGLSADPAAPESTTTSTTTSTTSTTAPPDEEPTEADQLAADDESPQEPDEGDGGGESGVVEPTVHCAQGVATLQEPVQAEVLSAGTSATNTTGESPTAVAPLAITG